MPPRPPPLLRRSCLSTHAIRFSVLSRFAPRLQVLRHAGVLAVSRGDAPLEDLRELSTAGVEPEGGVAQDGDAHQALLDGIEGAAAGLMPSLQVLTHKLMHDG
jgi:hypothetical protein